MTPLALFGLLYIICLPFKKPEPRETMEQFLDGISLVYPLTQQVYATTKRKEEHR